MYLVVRRYQQELLDEEREKELFECQRRIGCLFQNLSLLNEALTHRSFSYEKGEDFKDNQRLEFLGDALLGMLVSEDLYSRFPHSAEGGLSKLKAAVVSRSALASKARRLNLGDFLLLGKGEEASGGRRRPSNLADTFEAIIASIYLDGGLNACRQFILRQLSEKIEDVSLNKEGGDYKSALQEYAQAKFRQAPVYQVTSTQGPDHRRIFQVVVSVQGKLYGTGKGRSKKVAEQEAARQALKKLKG